MASLLVRDIPDDVLAGLKRLAEDHHRSVSAEVRRILEDSVNIQGRLAKFQEETRGRKLTPSIDLLRESRDER